MSAISKSSQYVDSTRYRGVVSARRIQGRGAKNENRVGGGDAEHGDARPRKPVRDDEERCRERHGRRQRERRERRERQRRVGRHVCKAGQRLRTVAQRMHDHAGGDEHEAQRADELALDDERRRQGVHRVRREVHACPSAAHQPVGVVPIGLAPFEHDARAEHAQAEGEAHGHATERADVRH